MAKYSTYHHYNRKHKGHFMGSTITWGTILILLGISLIIKTIIGIDLPIMRMLGAAFFIYLGVTMITGKKLFKHEPTWCSNHSDTECKGNSIDVTFAKRIIDMTEKSDTMHKMKINTVFGKTILLINPTIPTKIAVDAAFSSVSLPDGNMVSFGDLTYQTQRDQIPQLVIETKTIFGNLEIIEK